MQDKQKTALVLGATGGIGGAVTAALLARGWKVRALTRDVASARKRAPAAGIDWQAGDAMDGAAVADAARGASLIVHAVNPPGYRDWDKLVLPMLENTIVAAKAVGARILFPGTIYNYGPDAFPVLREDSPQHPTSRKGAIRVAMEQRLRQAAETGVPVTIVRAGDYFGPQAGNTWFAQGLVKPGKPLTKVSDPGTPGVGHTWAYLPNLAEAMLRLIERDGAATGFETFHFGGHWDADGRAMIEAVRRASGNAKLAMRRFPWAILMLASPFVTLFKEMREMRYLWRQPLRLDNARLVAALGEEPHTPLDAAVRRTLEGIGCLAPRPDGDAAHRPLTTAAGRS